MRRLLPFALLIACGGGDTEITDDTDTGPAVCQLVMNADTFNAQSTAAGDDSPVTLRFEADCPDAIGLTFSWRDPHSGAFSLPADLVADPTLTLQPYEPVSIEITFAPTAAETYRDKLVVSSDHPRVGGVILTFNGTGS